MVWANPRYMHICTYKSWAKSAQQQKPKGRRNEGQIYPHTHQTLAHTNVSHLRAFTHALSLTGIRAHPRSSGGKGAPKTGTYQRLTPPRFLLQESELSLTRFHVQESKRIRAAAEAKGHQKQAHTNVSHLRAFIHALSRTGIRAHPRSSGGKG